MNLQKFEIIYFMLGYEINQEIYVTVFIMP
jgi:hypothetical protein